MATPTTNLQATMAWVIVIALGGGGSCLSRVEAEDIAEGLIAATNDDAQNSPANPLRTIQSSPSSKPLPSYSFLSQARCFINSSPEHAFPNGPITPPELQTTDAQHSPASISTSAKNEVVTKQDIYNSLVETAEFSTPPASDTDHDLAMKLAATSDMQAVAKPAGVTGVNCERAGESPTTETSMHREVLYSAAPVQAQKTVEDITIVTDHTPQVRIAASLPQDMVIDSRIIEEPPTVPEELTRPAEMSITSCRESIRYDQPFSTRYGVGTTKITTSTPGENNELEIDLTSSPLDQLTVDTRALYDSKLATADKFPIRNDRLDTYNDATNVLAGCVRYDSPFGYYWLAPNFYHRPLYFEQPNVERYGHYICNDCVQSGVSAAHFFGSALVLPYKMGAQSHKSCDYTYGRYRPGSCNPRHLTYQPVSARGLLYQGLTVTGAAFLIP